MHSTGIRILELKRKLIDIGLCRFHRIFGILSGRLLKDIGWSEVANPRQSTSDVKLDPSPFPNKSTIALFYAFGIYRCQRKSASPRLGNLLMAVRISTREIK
jgi:hypothetical protein